MAIMDEVFVERLNAAARAVADLSLGLGWRMREVSRDIFRRCWWVSFRRLCEDGRVDAVKLCLASDHDAESPCFDLDDWVRLAVTFLRYRPLGSPAPIPSLLDYDRSDYVAVIATRDDRCLCDAALEAELSLAFDQGIETGVYSGPIALPRVRDPELTARVIELFRQHVKLPPAVVVDASTLKAE